MPFVTQNQWAGESHCAPGIAGQGFTVPTIHKRVAVRQSTQPLAMPKTTRMTSGVL
jgi:hypothetical protein